MQPFTPTPRRHRRLGLALAGCLVAAGLSFATSSAQACSYPPPPMPPMLAPLPDETEEAYARRSTLHRDGFFALERQRAADAVRARQQDVWSRAEKVAVVELVAVDSGDQTPKQMMGPAVRVTVRPVGWIKGSAGADARAPITLAYLGYTSCGPYPNWSVFRGQPGERFVMFLSEGAPRQEVTLDVLKPNDIVLGEVTAALAMQVRSAR